MTTIRVILLFFLCGLSLADARSDRWIAVETYRAGAYQQAAQLWAKYNTDEDHYNRGNALAHAGNIAEAIAAYNQALKLNPQHVDAEYNKKILEKNKADKNKPAQNDKNTKNKSNASNNESSNASNEKNSEPSKEKNTEADNTKLPVSINQRQNENQHLLNQIPEHPTGLLQQKFMREHLSHESGE